MIIKGVARAIVQLLISCSSTWIVTLVLRSFFYDKYVFVLVGKLSMQSSTRNGISPSRSLLGKKKHLPYATLKTIVYKHARILYGVSLFLKAFGDGHVFTIFGI